MNTQFLNTVFYLKMMFVNVCSSFVVIVFETGSLPLSPTMTWKTWGSLCSLLWPGTLGRTAFSHTSARITGMVHRMELIGACLIGSFFLRSHGQEVKEPRKGKSQLPALVTKSQGYGAS